MTRSILGPRYDSAATPFIGLDSFQRQTLLHLREALDCGDLALETTSCPLCSFERSRPIAVLDRYLLPVHTALCVQCGLVYRSRRLARDSADRFYNEFYHPLFKGRMTSEEYFRNQRIHGAFVFEFVKDVFRPGMFVAEIGSYAYFVLNHERKGRFPKIRSI